MQSLILQTQMLLAALGAFLPLLDDEHRADVAEVLDAIGRALKFGEAAAREVDDLAVKLKAVRLEIEAMVEAGRHASPDQIEAAFARVRAASTDFRAALAP